MNALPLMRPLLKKLANVIAFVLVAIPFAIYRVHAKVAGVPQAFPGWSQALSLMPGVLGVYLRRAFYRLALSACGSDVVISFGTVFSHASATLGDHVYIGVGCMIGDASLGDDVLVGSNVSIINGRQQHGIECLDVPIRAQPGRYPHVTVGRDVWIGDRAIVTENLGEHCVVGAGAVVVKSVSAYAIVAGNPARVIRFRADVGDARATTRECLRSATLSRDKSGAAPTSPSSDVDQFSVVRR